nr:hypothetical protein [Tanacetum cinerariifolium]
MNFISVVKRRASTGFVNIAVLVVTALGMAKVVMMIMSEAVMAKDEKGTKNFGVPIGGVGRYGFGNGEGSYDDDVGGDNGGR